METRALGPVASASLPSLSPRRAAAASQNAMAREMPGVRVEGAAAAAVAAKGRDCCCYLLLGVWEKVVVAVVVAKVGLLHRCHLLLPSPVTSVSRMGFPFLRVNASRSHRGPRCLRLDCVVVAMLVVRVDRG